MSLTILRHSCDNKKMKSEFSSANASFVDTGLTERVVKGVRPVYLWCIEFAIVLYERWVQTPDEHLSSPTDAERLTAFPPYLNKSGDTPRPFDGNHPNSHWTKHLIFLSRKFRLYCQGIKWIFAFRSFTTALIRVGATRNFFYNNYFLAMQKIFRCAVR